MHFPGYDQAIEMLFGEFNRMGDCIVGDASSRVACEANKIKSEFVGLF